MRGLIIKDGLVLWRQNKFMLLLVAVYGVLPAISGGSSFFASFSVLFCAMLPVTLMALDERARADRFFLTLPYSRAQVVISRYLTGLLLMVAAALFTGAVGLVGEAVRSGEADVSRLFSDLPVVGAGMIFDALLFPLLFKLGVEKGRLFFFALVVVAVGGGVAYTGMSDWEPRWLTAQVGSWAEALIWMGCLAVWLMSIGLSVRIYRQRAL